MLPKCEHGVSRNDGRFAGLWSAPFAECRCCGAAFPYLDSLTYGPDGGVARTWTKERCPQCGGHYRDDVLPPPNSALTPEAR